MMISTKGRYALRFLVDIAEHQAEGYVPLKDVAERQGISEKYLEIILKALVKGKIIKGLRGKGGGYMLTRSPEEYVIGEIIELTEGPLAPVACMLPDADPCPRKDNCKTLPLWEDFQKKIYDYFNNITLQDLVEDKIRM